MVGRLLNILHSNCFERKAHSLLGSQWFDLRNWKNSSWMRKKICDFLTMNLKLQIRFDEFRMKW